MTVKINRDHSTICAISTPAGVGGIAVARVSGPDSINIVSRIWRGADLQKAASHTAHLGTIFDPTTDADLDQAVVTIFKAPRSFTGEEVVEIAVHGSRWIQRELIVLLINNGAEVASPGEFTRRAFVNNRLDLAEAEAVADMIASNSRASHKVAMSQMRGDFSRRLASLRDQLLDLASLLELELDFSEEDVEFASRQRLIDFTDETLAVVNQLASSFKRGVAIKEGIPVAIIGETNAGKSSLLNAIVGDDRAIVSEIRGTTRDTIDETIDIDGITFRLTDTAGLRSTDDPIETIGIDRAIASAKGASLLIWVVDITSTAEAISDVASRIAPIVADAGLATHLIVAYNKTDVQTTQRVAIVNAIDSLGIEHTAIDISAKTREGIDRLKATIVEKSGLGDILTGNDIIVTNARHYAALTAAAESLKRVGEGLVDNLYADFIAQDLREALHHLGEITGTITTPDILATIFSRFCIGK